MGHVSCNQEIALVVIVSVLSIPVTITASRDGCAGAAGISSQEWIRPLKPATRRSGPPLLSMNTGCRSGVLAGTIGTRSVNYASLDGGTALKRLR